MTWAIATPAAPAPDHRIRIIRVPQGGPHHYTIAATRAAKCWTHFVNARTVGCPDDGSCSACAAGLARKFEAYLGVRDDRTGERCVLALPEGAWRQVEALLGDACDGHLWGRHVDFVRQAKGGARGQLEVFDAGPLLAGQPRPKGINTPLILLRAWGVKETSTGWTT